MLGVAVAELCTAAGIAAGSAAGCATPRKLPAAAAAASLLGPRDRGRRCPAPPRQQRRFLCRCLCSSGLMLADATAGWGCAGAPACRVVQLFCPYRATPFCLASQAVCLGVRASRLRPKARPPCLLAWSQAPRSTRLESGRGGVLPFAASLLPLFFFLGVGAARSHYFCPTPCPPRHPALCALPPPPLCTSPLSSLERVLATPAIGDRWLRM